MYVPRSQLPAKMDMTVSFEVLVATFIVRTTSSLGVLTPTFRHVVAEVDRNHGVTNVLTIEQYAAAQLQDLRHYAMLLGIFGGISVLLSFVGLFGIMANNVSQRRTAEFSAAWNAGLQSSPPLFNHRIERDSGWKGAEWKSGRSHSC
jgi:hypothetical protein